MTFLDIHVLQSVPFSCLNRDDTGTPKSATFGGVPRLRVSSQAWKRPTRDLLAKRLADLDDPAIRTRETVEHLAGLLVERGVSPEDADHLGRVVFKASDKGFPKDAGADEGADSAADDDKKRVLTFLTQSQYEDLAAYALDNMEDFKAAKSHAKDEATFKKTHRARVEALVSEPRGLIRLFGRMLADLPIANTDSALQVAHALTIHAALPEADYLTAVDDLVSARPGSSGAGGIFSQDFGSGTFYRFATINLAILERNGLTREEAVDLAVAAAGAFVDSLPSGKQNATAALVRPDFVALQVRDNPQNLVNAFETPLPAGDKGFVHTGVQKLTEYAAKLLEAYDEPALASFHVNTADVDASGPFGRQTGLKFALDAVREALG